MVRILLAGLLLCGAPAADAATVLITGANSGIGLELARQYAARGWQVIATHRRSAVPPALAELRMTYPDIMIETMDVTDAERVRAVANKLEGVPIDVLINNAGLYNDRSACSSDDCPGDWSTQSFGQLDYDLFDTIMAVNVKGPLLVSEAFRDHVRAGRQKKIVAISSTNGSLTVPYGGAGGGAIFYRASKAALNRAFQIVAANEKEAGVTVVMLHPGAVVTERQASLRGFQGMVELSESVPGLIAVIDRLTIEDAGRFMDYKGETMPW